MIDSDSTKALYDTARRAVHRLTSSDVRLGYEEWYCVDDLRRAVKEYERANGIDGIPF